VSFERTALREFRAELAQPSPEAVRRVRDVVTTGTVVARRRARAWVRWGVPVAVTGVVLALLVGMVAVVRPAVFGALVGSLPGMDRTDSRDRPGRASAAEHAAAVEALTALARAAGDTEALTVETGRLLYVWSMVGRTMFEMWLDVEGAIVLMDRHTDVASSFNLPVEPLGDDHPSVLRARAELAEKGPNLLRPTPAYLASLPTDPTALLTLMREQFASSAGSWSVDHAVFSGALNLLYRNEPLLTGPTRAALYRALAALPGVGSSGAVTYQGRGYVAIWFTERGEIQEELWFDPTTGRVVGQGPLTRAALWHHAVVDEVGANE
jgi:hypothetical protein